VAVALLGNAPGFRGPEAPGVAVAPLQGLR
jgi:hypothetical protein